MIHEDNAACIVLANSNSTKVQSKHIDLKWHHFKDQIKTGQIKIVKVDTHSNWADIHKTTSSPEIRMSPKINHGLVTLPISSFPTLSISSYEGALAQT
jgi:hypothetical protein